MELIILVVLFGLYIVCSIGADRREYNADRERCGICDDDDD